MFKIRNFKNKLLIIPFFIIMYILLYLFDTTCLIKKLTTIPCPGCGLSRAFFSFFSFNFKDAFSYHPLFWLIPILFLFYLYDGRMFKNKILNYIFLITILTSFIICWIIRVFILKITI